MKTFISKIINNHDGSTIVQMLVVTGIIGGLSLAVSTMMTNVSKTQTATENAQFTSEIEDTIQMALRTSASCSATVAGTPRVAGPNGALLASGRINEDIGGIVRHLVRTGDVLGNEMLTVEGAAGAPGPRLTVGEMRLITDPGGTPVTSYESGAVQNMTVTSARIRVQFSRGDDTAPGNEAMQAQRAYGTQQVIREFPIRVLVDAGNNIVSCHAGEAGVVENFCNSIEAIYRADGKCLEISIREDAANATNNYAITSRQAMLVRTDGNPLDGGLVVSNNPAIIPSPGDLHVQGDAFIGDSDFPWVDGNASVAGNMLVQGTGEIRNNVSLGNIAVVPNVGPRLVVQGAGTRITKAGDGSVLSLLESDAAVADSAIRLNNVSATDSFRVSSSITTGALFEQYVDGVLRFRVSDTGAVEIPRPAASSVATNPVPALDIGIDGQPYFAWKIFNQPASVMTPSHWQIVGDRGDEVATKRWAARSVYSFLQTDTASVGNITSTLAGYSNNNQLQAMRRNICANLSRMNLIMGAGHSGNVGNGTYVNGSGCTINPVACSSTGNRCGVLHVRGINSTGEILATGSGASVRLAGAGTVTLTSSGTIVASNNISSNLEVVGVQTMRGTGTGASEGVCSANGCAQSLGRQLCPTGTVMIGWDRGTIACGAGYW